MSSGMSLVQSALPNPSMLTDTTDHTSDFLLMERDIEADLDMTVLEEELNKKGRPLINWVKPIEWLLLNAEIYEEWEEGEEDEDDDFVDLYGSAHRDGNSWEDSDRVYREEVGDTEEEEEEKGEEEEEEEKALSLMFIKSEDEDIDMMEKWDSDEN
ncbi:hypothetical protein HOY80DRAFT_1088330 [Tuber brumale]|nr:hypothetical protein HOY80DRAFT_1088330 [Tuber brumale]